MLRILGSCGSGEACFQLVDSVDTVFQSLAISTFSTMTKKSREACRGCISIDQYKRDNLSDLNLGVWICGLVWEGTISSWYPIQGLGKPDPKDPTAAHATKRSKIQ